MAVWRLDRFASKTPSRDDTQGGLVIRWWLNVWLNPVVLFEHQTMNTPDRLWGDICELSIEANTGFRRPDRGRHLKV
jgi:hypothetical protein